MEKISLSAISSSRDDPYLVTFTKHDDGLLTIWCTCPAGQRGQLCKHKSAFALCDTSMLYDSSQTEDLERAIGWIQASDYPELLRELQEIEDKKVSTEKRLKAIKDKIAKCMSDGIQCEGLPLVREKDKPKREIRSLKLIADFEGGYAKDWYFAVGEAFKDQLDVKLTPRKEKGKEVLKWTQGKFFTFAEGHVLYDTPKAYLPTWAEALKHIKFRCEVIRAVPCSLDDKGRLNHGSVTFTLSKPTKDRSSLEVIDQYHLTQPQFVEFLKTGKLKER